MLSGHPSPTDAVVGDFNAVRAVRGLVAFAGLGIGISALYAGSGIGFPCPFRLATGWNCPLCGGTRLGAALLHLDLGAAFAYNPAVFIGLVVASVLGALWVVEALGGPAVRPPRAVAARWRAITPSAWLGLGLAGAAVYTVLRNTL